MKRHRAPLRSEELKAKHDLFIIASLLVSLPFLMILAMAYGLKDPGIHLLVRLEETSTVILAVFLSLRSYAVSLKIRSLREEERLESIAREVMES